MTPFIHDNFALRTATARRLYHEHAARLPVIDYHCHLDPGQLADDHAFANIAQAWVTADPYKHRAMRMAGVPEHFITGPATDREKFDRWAATVPLTLGNPLYAWTALELARHFDIAEPLSPESADRVWAASNGQLADPRYAARGLVAQFNVECLCTSDRLLDDLEPHARLSQSTFATRVLPSLRGDDVTAVEQPGYSAWLAQLGAATHTTIDSFPALRHAVSMRLDRFDQRGCRLADHALDDFAYVPIKEDETAALFERRLAGATLTDAETARLRSGIYRVLGAEYGRRDWVMQLHIGAQRQTSTRLRRLAGPAGGYASIGKACDVPSLCRFLDDLEQQAALPRTILYALNPADYAVLASLCGSYAEDGVSGKIQFGPAWWYNDHAAGIRQHLDAVASYGLLSTFIGMTTDSRSFLSLPRHEYFRRLLCDYLGEQAESGALPADEDMLALYVRSIAYDNPRRWFSQGASTTNQGNRTP